MSQLVYLLTQTYWFPSLLIVAALALVLIDFLFPTDWPAYLGYVFFAIGMGGIAAFESFSVRFCFGLAVLVALLVLHQIWLARFLTNADDDEEEEKASAASS